MCSSDLDIRPGEVTDDSPHGTFNSDEAEFFLGSDEILDVSEADIARIVPRVLSHRLRVRDRPEDEILGSLMYSAVGTCAECLRHNDEDDGDKQNTWERSTVKDILVKILAEV